ncbi:nuclear transport factor 2 family protein [Flagellimonas sp.]|uniref:nuclear transport factor 2 family protein n=1 Tax=Flagellimonas sp. TaxID=2058762 RepID=UPI003B504A04
MYNSPQYIFNQENLEGHAQDLSAIYDQMGKYYEGVERANISLLDEVFHKNWFMRDTDTPKEATLNVENKQKFIDRVRNHGPYLNYAKHRKFANTGLANGNLAFVRINKKSATSFFLFKLDGKWILMDKLWATMESQSADQNRSLDFFSVDRLVTEYFEAVKNSDSKTLEAILHSNWDKKTINADNHFKITDKNQFLQNLPVDKGNIPHTKLMSMDLYHGKLAIVRVDFTDESSTSFFVCFKLNGQWTIAGERSSINKTASNSY